MRSPIDEGPWLIRDEVASTQDVATEFLNQTEEEVPGIVFAYDQKRGRGRFHREWHSDPNQSLTMSLVYRSYSSHPKPWFIGMAVAVAVAGAVDGKVCWPNDVYLGGKKVGGVLTELVATDRFGKVPVVGVGVNLNQAAFPTELADRATSLLLETGQTHDPLELAKVVVGRIIDMPEPDVWASIEPVWKVFDDTPGKSYRLPTGEKAEAVRIGSSGELVCLVDGKQRTVLAGEAIFGDI